MRAWGLPTIRWLSFMWGTSRDYQLSFFFALQMERPAFEDVDQFERD